MDPESISLIRGYVEFDKQPPEPQKIDKPILRDEYTEQRRFVSGSIAMTDVKIKTPIGCGDGYGPKHIEKVIGVSEILLKLNSSDFPSTTTGGNIRFVDPC
jgi:hypothetical protein